MKQHIQRFGQFLSGMIIPNIGAFIAWGLITAFFIPTGWTPHEGMSSLVGPIIVNLLPILIGYTGGRMVGGQRGAVVGAIMTMGVIVGSEIPMFLGAMIVGPLGGWVIKKIDDALHGKIPAGFEMLVNNFTAGIAGMGLAIFAYFIVGPIVGGISTALGKGVEVLVENRLLALVSILVEPAKVLFLNNAINHGVFSPLGIEQAAELGKSIFFTIETNPGPGLGILLAYWIAGRGLVKQSAPGAIIIHFFGGIHEIYFPYILMRPILILPTIVGGASGVLMNLLFKGGLSATPSPGSVFAIYALTPKTSIIATTLALAVSTVVTVLLALPLIKRSEDSDEQYESAVAHKAALKQEAKGLTGKVSSVVIACDAGMGSSVMASTLMKKALEEANVQGVNVSHVGIANLEASADVVITHEKFLKQAQGKAPNARIYAIANFMDKAFYTATAKDIAGLV